VLGTLDFDTLGHPRDPFFEQKDPAILLALDDDRLTGAVVATFGDAEIHQLGIGQYLVCAEHLASR
jgi:hypothetical protein